MAVTSTKVQISIEPAFNTPLVDRTFNGYFRFISRSMLPAIYPTGVPLYARCKYVDDTHGESEWGPICEFKLTEAMGGWEPINDFMGTYSNNYTERKYMSCVSVPVSSDVPYWNRFLVATNDPDNDNKLTVYFYLHDIVNNNLNLVGQPLVLDTITVPAGNNVTLIPISDSVILLNYGTTDIIPIKIQSDTSSEIGIVKGANNLVLSGGNIFTKIGQVTGCKLALDTAAIVITSGITAPDTTRVIGVKYNKATDSLTQGTALAIQMPVVDHEHYAIANRLDDTRAIVIMDRKGATSALPKGIVVTVNTAGNLNVVAGAAQELGTQKDDVLIGAVALSPVKVAAILKTSSNGHTGFVLASVASGTITPLNTNQVTSISAEASTDDVFVAASETTIVGQHGDGNITITRVSPTNEVTLFKNHVAVGARTKLNGCKQFSPLRICRGWCNKVFVAYTNRIMRMIG